MRKMDGLKHVGDASWDEVFEVWRDNEELNPICAEAWKKVATEIKGWDSWESWRRYQASQLDFANREWKIYEIDRPKLMIPGFLVGPFGGWQDQVSEGLQLRLTFRDFVAERAGWVREHDRIPDMLENFPSPTQMTGLYLADQDEIVCFEGSHRAAAVALAESEGKSIDFGENPLMAITVINKGSSELLRKALAAGSENPDREN